MTLLSRICDVSGQQLSVDDVRQSLEQCDPVIVLVDMDCFFVQVEQLAKPETRGTPCAVMQFTDTGNGTIIALSYEAKARGVGKFSHAKEAKEKCPEIHLFVVPSRYQKADTGRYQNAGNRVVEVIQSHFSLVCKASVDESYIDISTESKKFILDAVAAGEKSSDETDGSVVKSSMFNSTEIYGVPVETGQRTVDIWIKSCFDKLLTSPEDGRAWNDLLQLAGAVLVERMRADILARLEFHCSAGIAASKTLAKLCCGINKPRRQTVLPASQLKSLLAATPLNKIKSYGGKYGKEVQQKLQIKNVGDLLRFSREQLMSVLGEKNGASLFRFAKYGLDGEDVKVHDAAKSIGSSKNFPGANCLKTLADLQKWVMAFSEQLNERVCRDADVTNRAPTLLTVHLRYYKLNELNPHCLQTLLRGGKISGRDYYLLTLHTASRCAPLHGDWTQAKIFDNAMKIILKTFPCYSTEKLYSGSGEPGRGLPKLAEEEEEHAAKNDEETDEKFPCPSCNRVLNSEQAIRHHLVLAHRNETTDSAANSSGCSAKTTTKTTTPTTSASLAHAKDLVFITFVMLCAGKMESRADKPAGIRQFLVKRDASPDKLMSATESAPQRADTVRKKRKFGALDEFFSKSMQKPHATATTSLKAAMPIDCITLSDSSMSDADETDIKPETSSVVAADLKTSHTDEMLHGKMLNSATAVKRNNSTSVSTPARAAAASKHSKKVASKYGPPDGCSKIDKFFRKKPQPQYVDNDADDDDEVVVLDD